MSYSKITDSQVIEYNTKMGQSVAFKNSLGTEIQNLGEDALYTDKTLTTAQLLALFTTPITVLAAPGAGYANIVTSVYGSIDYAAATYSGANDIVLKYTNASGVVVATFTAAFLNSSADAGMHAVAASGVCVANAVIVASMGTANPTVGDSALKLRIYYKKVLLPM